MGKIIKRKWGTYEVLKENKEEGYKVKILTVDPKRWLCDQLHRHRDETWYILSGSGRFKYNRQSDDTGYHMTHVFPGQMIEIFRGDHHSIENDGCAPLVFVEVQEGEYLEEDDIVRFDTYPDDWEKAFAERVEKRGGSTIVDEYYEF